MDMTKIMALLVWVALLAPALHTAARPLTRGECKVIVKDLERMSNLQPHDLDTKAREALERLRDGETRTDYFVAYNIYAENLFNRGLIDEAQHIIEEMMSEAAALSDVECTVIALRTEGQFYYKLGLFDRADECFRKAMEMCPRYDSDRLEHCFTWSSTLFWLVQTDLRTGHVEEAEHNIADMDDMMQWLEGKGVKDTVGYKPVMIRGLKAKIALRRNDRDEAVRLLAECPQYMREDIPERAYVEYYVAMMQLHLLDDRHDLALPLLDRLIEMHITDYKPIAAEYLQQKGLSLAELGRYRESAETLKEYIRLKEEVDRTAMATQLGELSTRYKVEKLQHERDNMQRQLMIALAICIALAVIITIAVESRRRLRHKNRTLANTISELSRMARESTITAPPAAPEIPGDDTTGSSTASAETIATGARIVDYITTSQCYLRPDCGRDTIKDALGVPERTLAKAIVAATGMTFVNYINSLRLNLSIEMLEEKPEMTIGDISTACGFGTVRQFQRIFKQCYDMTPSAYREARSATPDKPLG